MKRLGIVGGMGPQATVDLFQKIIDLTPANRDQDHIPIVIDNYPQVPDRTAYLCSGGENPLPYLLESVKRLERAGVDCLCIACNTAHYFIDELRAATSLEFISMVESVLDDIKKSPRRYSKVGILATDGTIKGRVYHRPFAKAGIEIVDLDASLQKIVMDAIYLLKAGRTQKAVERFRKALAAIDRKGYECLIAACTEIPVLFSHVKEYSGADVYDATYSLAKRVVEYCFVE